MRMPLKEKTMPPFRHKSGRAVGATPLTPDFGSGVRFETIALFSLVFFFGVQLVMKSQPDDSGSIFGLFGGIDKASRLAMLDPSPPPRKGVAWSPAAYEGGIAKDPQGMQKTNDTPHPQNQPEKTTKPIPIPLPTTAEMRPEPTVLREEEPTTEAEILIQPNRSAATEPSENEQRAQPTLTQLSMGDSNAAGAAEVSERSKPTKEALRDIATDRGGGSSLVESEEPGMDEEKSNDDNSSHAGAGGMTDTTVNDVSQLGTSIRRETKERNMSSTDDNHIISESIVDDVAHQKLLGKKREKGGATPDSEENPEAEQHKPSSQRTRAKKPAKSQEIERSPELSKKSDSDSGERSETELGEAVSMENAAEEGSSAVARRSVKAVPKEKKTTEKFLGVDLGVVDGVNLTRLSFMFYRVVLTNPISSVLAYPCSMNSHWLPEVVTRLDFDAPGFQFICADESDKKLKPARKAFKRLEFVEYSVAKIGEEDALPTVDMAFSWGGMHGWNIQGSWAFFKMIRAAQISYVLFENNPKVTNMHAVSRIAGIDLTKLPTGVNVRKPPFLFLPATKTIGEITSDEWNPRVLLFYSVGSMRNDMS